MIADVVRVYFATLYAYQLSDSPIEPVQNQKRTKRELFGRGFSFWAFKFKM